MGGVWKKSAFCGKKVNFRGKRKLHHGKRQRIDLAGPSGHSPENCGRRQDIENRRGRPTQPTLQDPPRVLRQTCSLAPPRASVPPVAATPRRLPARGPPRPAARRTPASGRSRAQPTEPRPRCGRPRRPGAWQLLARSRRGALPARSGEDEHYQPTSIMRTYVTDHRTGHLGHPAVQLRLTSHQCRLRFVLGL